MQWAVARYNALKFLVFVLFYPKRKQNWGCFHKSDKMAVFHEVLRECFMRMEWEKRELREQMLSSIKDFLFQLAINYLVNVIMTYKVVECKQTKLHYNCISPFMEWPDLLTYDTWFISDDISLHCCTCLFVMWLLTLQYWRLWKTYVIWDKAIENWTY